MGKRGGKKKPSQEDTSQPTDKPASQQSARQQPVPQQPAPQQPAPQQPAQPADGGAQPASSSGKPAKEQRKTKGAAQVSSSESSISEPPSAREKKPQDERKTPEPAASQQSIPGEPTQSKGKRRRKGQKTSISEATEPAKEVPVKEDKPARPISVTPVPSETDTFTQVQRGKHAGKKQGKEQSPAEERRPVTAPGPAPVSSGTITSVDRGLEQPVQGAWGRRKQQEYAPPGFTPRGQETQPPQPEWRRQGTPPATVTEMPRWQKPQDTRPASSESVEPRGRVWKKEGAQQQPPGKPHRGEETGQPRGRGGGGLGRPVSEPAPGMGRGTRYPQQVQQPREVPKGRGPLQMPAGDAAQASSKPSDSALKAVTEKLGELSVVQRKNMRSGGKLGRKIIVETNHLPLVISKKVNVAIHYDISITPDKPKRMMRPVWEAYRRKYIPNMHPAFDEVKNLYSPFKIPDDKLVGEVLVQEDDYSRDKEYKVVIKYAASVNLIELDNYMRNCFSNASYPLPQAAIQCLDVVLRNAPALRFTRVGRSYFSQPSGQIIKLGDGMEMWHGFYQSAVLGWKPYLNIDVAHKGFPKDLNIIDLIAELLYRNTNQLTEPLSAWDMDTVSKYVKGLKIKYEIPNQMSSRRSIRVNGCLSSAGQATFKTETGEMMTVERYYRDKKNYRLRFPHMPIVWVGSKDKRIYYPAELCTILKGQVTNRKLTENQTREMVRNAATSTTVRKNKILESINKAQFNDDPCIRAFGLQVGNTFERVEARVLDPPTLQYSATKHVVPSKGVWRSAEFIDGKTINSWTVLVTSRTKDEDIDKMVQMLQRGAVQNRMHFANVTKPYQRMQLRGDPRPLNEYFERNKKMDLIIVIVPEGDMYNKVKRSAEINVGCLTQCIKERTMFKSLNPSTISNILLKINSKLNGHNHKIADVSRPLCLQRPCMIMGADVTHPPPDQLERPSIAAVAASHEPTAFKYNFCWRLQPARQEIITDLENMVVDQLRFFHKYTNFAPQAIIFFRDGVSEGQFAEVQHAEVNAIKRACQRMSQNYTPKITFLVVQKRHHTRFFPTRPQDSEDRNYNVPAGTCVDTEIIHPTGLEYYLVSHASIQGVARPTKYRILLDDLHMNEDEIQTLTYYLCHMFTRCTRSVSYPAPTYYAHLAAARASVYFEGRDINMDNLEREHVLHKIKDEICKERPMFFV